MTLIFYLSMLWSIEEPEKIRLPRGRLNIGCYLLLFLQLWCVFVGCVGVKPTRLGQNVVRFYLKCTCWDESAVEMYQGMKVWQWHLM